MDNSLPTCLEWLLGQQGAIFLSMIAAVMVALWQVGQSRVMAKKRATIDLLTQRAWDKDYLKNRRDFIRLRDHEDGLEKWADISKDGSTSQRTINNALNDYEIVAIGIDQEILDEDFYRRWYETQFLKDFDRTVGYINSLNDRGGKSGKYYIEMQALAEKWKCSTRSK